MPLREKAKRLIKRKLVGLLHPQARKGGTVGTHNLSRRETWLERTLAAIPSGHRFLDAGAGEEQYQRFCDHLEYISQDFGAYDGRGDGAGKQTGEWDQTSLDIVPDDCVVVARCYSERRPDSSEATDFLMRQFESRFLPIRLLRFKRNLCKTGR